MTIFSKNLKTLRAKKGYKQAEIAESIGITVSTWSNYEVGKSEPSLELLIKISDFFGTSVDALLSPAEQPGAGHDPENQEERSPSEGSLIKKDTIREKNTKKAFSFSPAVLERMPQVVTVDSTGDENIVLVPQRARAGYLAGYGDPEFISALPSYRLPGMDNGTFRMFEVYGHSMIPTFHESDIIVSRFVDNLADIRDDRVHVVVTRRDGVVVKRVVNRVANDGKLILNSDNQRHAGEYPPIVVDPEDILEIWYAVAYMSRQMRAPKELYNRMIDVEARLTLLERNLKKSDL
jgi:transcriptional regulator with XRE-family HTH domain/signal peptidase I